ncbi:MAG TPA: helix-turn-helix transcriptional regulator [Thermoanaerobaculia bacterium]|nr:helix-turn-helix transcriptional regulator [Thermoanaerobaculia bacterium]
MGRPAVTAVDGLQLPGVHPPAHIPPAHSEELGRVGDGVGGFRVEEEGADVGGGHGGPPGRSTCARYHGVCGLSHAAPWFLIVYVRRRYDARVTRRADRRPETELFGVAVRRRREAAGMSQDRLADAAGMSQRYLRAIERGENSPSLTAIFQVCEALGVSPSELIDEVWRER